MNAYGAGEYGGGGYGDGDYGGGVYGGGFGEEEVDDDKEEEWGRPKRRNGI